MSIEGGTVQVAGLEFGYGDDGQLLRGVSLRVASGEVCALLGPNGAGKTTLLRCLLGLLTPDSGVITVAGADVAKLSARELARLIAYVPQSSTPAFPFTTLDVVVMGRTPHLRLTDTPSATDREAATDTLRQVGIAHLADRAFTQLSGGERQLALIARALTQQCRRS